MGLQPTASNTDLLLGCQRPFDPNVPLDPPDEDEDTSGRDYGSAFAEARRAVRYGTPATKVSVAGLATSYAFMSRYGLGEDITLTLATHVARAEETLKTWLAGQGNLAPVHVEAPFALFVLNQGGRTLPSRECGFDKETHIYDLKKGEMGGTADLVLASNAKGKSDPRVVVWDDKTGADDGRFSKPSEMGQMLTLALIHDATHVAVCHTPPVGIDAVYVEEVTPKQKQEHHKRLRLALRRIGDDSLRPGPWCKYCPTKETCVAGQGEILKESSAIVRTAIESGKLAAPTDLAQLHDMLKELSRLEKIARADLREKVRTGTIVEKKDGKVLVITTREVERLSKKAFVDVLGVMAAEREFDRLRELGVLVKQVEERLEAK